MRAIVSICCSIVMASFAVEPALAQQGETNSPDGGREDEQGTADSLLDVSLEDLLAREVTTVAKKLRRIDETPAAITVVTQEDIRRSGASSIPEVLRSVPGLEVAEVQSSSTTISARGFSTPFPTNLLVMVDGASIYRTSVSGMFWDQALAPLQDIERIEIIRGPGSTIWGSNAISGIVNIITKQSIDTQGLRANISAGTNHRSAELGYGVKISKDAALRAYANLRATDGLESINGKVTGTDWKGGLLGGRLDLAPSSNDTVVALMEYSKGSFSDRILTPTFEGNVPVQGVVVDSNTFQSVHALARWHRHASSNLELTAQTYFNWLQRTQFDAELSRSMVDASVGSLWRAGKSHELSAGVSVKKVANQVASSFALSLPKGSQEDHSITAYLQDEIELVPDSVRLTLGSKVEYNNFTGLDFQPSVRMLYRDGSRFTAWAAVTRGIKNPILLQRSMVTTIPDIYSPNSGQTNYPSFSRFFGNDDVASESVLSLEVGARGRIDDNWTFDLAAFGSRFSHLTTARPRVDSPGSDLPLVLAGLSVTDFLLTNEGAAESFGFEASFAGKIADWWKLDASYSYLNLKTRQPGLTFILSESGASSQHQLRTSSTFKLTDQLSLFGNLHYVSTSRDGRRPAYLDADLRAALHLTSQLELALTGSNLLQERRLEYKHDQLPVENVYVPRMLRLEARLRL